MSAIVEDVGTAVEGTVKNVFTTVGVAVGIAVFALAFPFIIDYASKTIGLAGQYKTQLGY